MEVPALCVRLLTTVLLLLVAQVEFGYSQAADAAFPQVVPNRQQNFEYDPIVVSCEGLEGLTGWRVMKKIKGVTTTCASGRSTSTGPCRIKAAFPSVDSGEYWCEMGGKRSNSVNITVTAGSVILESPVLPVMEGESVTLRCRKKQTSSSFAAVYFKNGYFMESSSTENMTIHSVSKSNEGLYKCSTSEGGESAESWLLVTAAQEDPGPQPSLLLGVGLSVLALLLSAAAFLLLSVGLPRCRKRQTIIQEAGVSSCSATPVSCAYTDLLMTEENSLYYTIK